MAQPILLLKEQDTSKERVMKLNDLVKLFDNRLKRLETKIVELEERIDDLED